MKIDKTKTPDQVYESLVGEERVTAFILREIILETLPEAREKLSWGAPFYFGKRSVCYVWPASVPWGKLDAGVALGFSRARELDHGGYLTVAEQKFFGRRVYLSPEEIEVERVVELLRAAWALG